METVLLACEQVRNSKRLRKLLQTVLVLGNYLNGTSFRGEAYGFKLEALLNVSRLHSMFCLECPSPLSLCSWVNS